MLEPQEGHNTGRAGTAAEDFDKKKAPGAGTSEGWCKITNTAKCRVFLRLYFTM